ncbi:MAG: hypothetical protein ACYTG6_17165 [Planctomycetota bacterium]|jgi:hypothetical protein
MGPLRWIPALTTLGLLLLAPAALGGPIYEIDYASYDVRVMDTKGISTEARDFGFYTGPNILNARRGDAYVEIPFRKIRTIEVGTYIPSKGFYPCTVVSRTGRTFRVEIERIEGQRFMGGNTAVGSIRIRLGQVQRLEFIRLSRTEDFE